MLQGLGKAKDEAYHDVDIFTTALWYHNKVKDNLYDSAHQFANAIKQLLIYIGNKAGNAVRFKDKHREYEIQQLGRFAADLGPTDERKFPKPPWVALNLVEIDAVCKKLRVPSNWPRVRKIFKDALRMKSAELLLLAGDAGAYFVRIMGIRADYKEVFIDLLRLLERSCLHMGAV